MHRLNLLDFAKVLPLREAPEKSDNALHIAFSLEEDSLEKAFSFSKAAVDFSLGASGPIQDGFTSNEDIIFQSLKAAKDAKQTVKLPETLQGVGFAVLFSDSYDQTREENEQEVAKIVRREFIESATSPELPSSNRANALRDLTNVLTQHTFDGWTHATEEDRKLLTSIATSNLEDRDQNVRRAAGDLLHMLDRTRVLYIDWEKTVNSLFDSSSAVRDKAMTLLKMDAAPPETVEMAAFSCLENPSPDIQVLGLKLYNHLARSGKFLEEAHAAAAKNLESGSENIRAEVRELYGHLAPRISTITQQEVQALLQIATADEQLNIFREFAQKYQFLKEAHEIAAQNLQNQHNPYKTIGLYLVLADTAAVVDITAQEIESMIQMFDRLDEKHDPVLQDDILSVFGAFAKNGKFFSEAHALAAKALPKRIDGALNLYFVLAAVDDITREELQQMHAYAKRGVKAYLVEMYEKLSKIGKFLQEAYAVALEPDVSLRQRAAIYANLLKHKFDGLSQDAIIDIVFYFINNHGEVAGALIALIESNLYTDQIQAAFEQVLRRSSPFSACMDLIANASPTTQHTVMKLIHNVAQKGVGLYTAMVIGERQKTSEDPAIRALASELLEEVTYRKSWLGWLTSWVNTRQSDTWTARGANPK